MDDMPGPDASPRLAGLLARVPLMARELPDFDAGDAPADPAELFARWLVQARAAGVPDAHAVTLATVDPGGAPDARVVALRDVDPPSGRWFVATSADSPKGAQLAACPAAAMCLYWPAQGRQIRVRGPVSACPARTAAEDFASRSPASRAAALVGRQSRPLPSPAAYDAAEAAARDRLARDPAAVPPDHRVYALRATAVEFWQGSPDRRHVRLLYTRPAPDGTVWERRLLWP
jgi:pyridoxamine 5'-phosphate oxidase